MSEPGAPVDQFAATLPFPLDDFQRQACEAIAAGRGLLLAAPTGAGKTIAGEFAVHLALATGRKAFYTTPIKALSNQKYLDLVRRHGVDRVGLLTGDSQVNGEAPVVVMTTEVLRNMMYADSGTLRGLGYVVLDEVHYLADRFRGAVWEEVIMHLPPSVQVVALSATVSNAEEFGAWLGEVRGEMEVVVSEHRPVPLWQHMMVGTVMHDLFTSADEPGAVRPVNPEVIGAIRTLRAASSGGRYQSPVGRGAPRDGPHDGPRDGSRDRSRDRSRGGSGGIGRARRVGGQIRDYPGDPRSGHRPGRGSRPGGGPSRPEVIVALERAGLLPAITFIFSRAGCEAAVQQLLASGLRLIPVAEGERVHRIVEERIAGLADEDLGVLGYYDFVDGLCRGFAAHHAGMLPSFREVVEELFTAGSIKAVFATETLALGINMPARTVVLEKLVKFNGEAHVDITPAEFTQLTGRAGRRGIDVEGHSVILYANGLDPAAVAGLASTRTYPLRSSFAPTYNMAVNLVRQVGRERAKELLETSFAQFQADRAVVGLVRTTRKQAQALAGYEDAMACDRGDFAQYAQIRNAIRDLEKDGSRARAARDRVLAQESLAQLRPGDVIQVPAGRRAGFAVVIQASRGGALDGPAPTVVTEDRQLRQLTVADVPVPIAPLTNVRIPKGFNPKSPKSRRDLAATLRIHIEHEPPPDKRRIRRPAAAENVELEDLRTRLRAHPCHSCPDRETHARWAERAYRLRRELAGAQRKVDARTTSVAATFERICAALTSLGYLQVDAGGATGITADGERLRRLYTEKDLLVAECLRSGRWARLDPPSLAAVVSAIVHEPRRESRDGQSARARVPNADTGEAIEDMLRVWSGLEDLEHEHSLPLTSPPDAGMAWMVHRWAGGQRLETVLRDSDLAAGDFVRRCKQIVDLLGQLAQAAGGTPLAGTAREAADAMLRGVVAADRLD